jgi:hypothetical protein
LDNKIENLFQEKKIYLRPLPKPSPREGGALCLKFSNFPLLSWEKGERGMRSIQ